MQFPCNIDNFALAQPGRSFPSSNLITDFPKRQFAGTSICQKVNMPKRQYAETSIHRNVTSPIRQFTETSICRHVNIPRSQFTNASVNELSANGRTTLQNKGIRADGRTDRQTATMQNYIINAILGITMRLKYFSDLCFNLLYTKYRIYNTLIYPTYHTAV